jgi:hypothetical protein
MARASGKPEMAFCANDARPGLIQECAKSHGIEGAPCPVYKARHPIFLRLWNMGAWAVELLVPPRLGGCVCLSMSAFATTICRGKNLHCIHRI